MQGDDVRLELFGIHGRVELLERHFYAGRIRDEFPNSLGALTANQLQRTEDGGGGGYSISPQTDESSNLDTAVTEPRTEVGMDRVAGIDKGPHLRDTTKTNIEKNSSVPGTHQGLSWCCQRFRRTFSFKSNAADPRAVGNRLYLREA